MSDVWEHSDRVSCTHPGWVTLHGWAQVAGSFVAFFQNASPIQFVTTNAHVQVEGRVAWVVLDEDLLGEQGGVTVSVLNVFVCDADSQWRMVGHQASFVAPPTQNE